MDRQSKIQFLRDVQAGRLNVNEPVIDLSLLSDSELIRIKGMQDRYAAGIELTAIDEDFCSLIIKKYAKKG